MSKRGKKKLRERFHKACRTRWLSSEKAIQGVYNDFVALTQTLRQLKEEHDSAAIGLLKQIGNFKFLRAVYLLNEVLPILAHLGKDFQKGVVSFAAIDLAIKFTLEAIADEQKPLISLKKIFQRVADFSSATWDHLLLLMRSNLQP